MGSHQPKYIDCIAYAWRCVNGTPLPEAIAPSQGVANDGSETVVVVEAGKREQQRTYMREYQRRRRSKAHGPAISIEQRASVNAS